MSKTEHDKFVKEVESKKYKKPYFLERKVIKSFKRLDEMGLK